MSTAFNPYVEWLELPAELTSPNFYELLSLRLLESDAETIASSADRAMSRVRACKPGPNAPNWAQLLDEISAAKACLTNAEQKRAYDQKLQLSEVLEATSMALGDPNMNPPGPSQASAATAPASPAAAQPIVPVAPQPVPQLQPAAAALDPMDPMAPAPFAVPGAPNPMAATVAPVFPQAMPAATPAPVAPVAQPMATPHATPTGAAAQPVMLQAAPVVAAQSAQAAPSVQPVSAPQAQVGMPAAEAAKPAVKKKTSATAMAMQRSGSGFLLPVLIGGGVGMVVLLFVGLTIMLKTDDSETEEVVRVEASAPVEAPKRVEGPVASAPVESEVTSPSTPPTTSSPIPVPVSPPPMEATTPTPTPEPTTPTPEPEPEPTGPTRKEVRDLAKALTTARDAIVEHNFTLAATELSKAEALAQSDEHKAKVSRLKLLGDYVKEFRAAIDKTVDGFGIGDQVTFDESISFGIVDKTPSRLIIRLGGQNRPYDLNNLSPGLARRLGEMSLAKGEPKTLALQAAFVSLMPKAKDDDMAKVQGWWKEAGAIADVKDLIVAINDDYSLNVDLAKVPLDGNAMEQLTGFVDRLKDARTIDEFAKEYQAAIDEGIKKLEPDMELEVGSSTIVKIQDVQPERILVEFAGLKRGYRRDDLPRGFASALADQTIPRDVPLAMVMKGAYFAKRDGPKKQFREQVLKWWQAAGEADPDLQPVIQELAKQYPE